MNDTQILKEAKALINTPEAWCKVSVAKRADGEDTFYDDEVAVQWCAWGAVRRVLGYIDVTPTYIRVEDFLDQAAGEIDPEFWSFIGFNDAEGTPHAEVMEMFDRAIALSEQAAVEGDQHGRP